MIIFKKIKWKNFLSTGDHWNEVNFQEATTNLIIGVNGAGKSTMLDALTFVLFNKSFRKITKSQLINSSNERECLVEIEFSSNNKNYFVRRGIKPNVFDIEIDGNQLSKQADDRSNQKILEENILKLNYKSFTQIVILGSSTFVPFMQLSVNNRREVIEDLLDIRIFSAMNNLIKEKLRVQRENLRSLDLKKDNIKDKIDMQKNFIKELEEQGKSSVDSKKKKIDSLSTESEGCSIANLLIEGSVDTLIEQQEKLIGAGEKLLKLNNLKGKLSNRVSTLTKEHKFFSDNVSCPTCTQPIEEEFRLNKITDVQTKAKELKKGYKDLEETIKKEQDRERQFQKISKEIIKLNNDIVNDRSEIWNQKFKLLPNNLKIEILNMKN